MSPPVLAAQTALVTGASRGVGKGIAEALARAGATVYGTGRTIAETKFDVTSASGRVVPLRCDHTVDSDVERVFEKITREAGRLDILVNNVWGGYERMVEDGVFTWTQPFWEQPLHRWPAMFDSGVRAHYACSAHAARMMVVQESGLIVNISFWAAKKHVGNVIYGMSKAATDKLTADAALELRDHGVTVVSLYPGLVRTEAVMAAADALDLTNSESPQFIGRGVAALASDPERLERTGQVLIAAELARSYGFTDSDGRQPRPLDIDEA